MVARRAEKGKRIVHFTTYIEQHQNEFIEKRKKFKVHQFIRDKLNEYIYNFNQLQSYGKKTIK